MIDLYTFATPNGRKPAILLEELGIPYTVHPVDISQGEQFSPDYVAINPNSKIPAIIDQDTGITVFESGAILMYLAEKTGKFLPAELAARYQVVQWLMFQMAGVGPMFGQLGHFQHSAPEEVPYAVCRYEKETNRLFDVMNRQLERQEYLAGEYSIADIATLPWVAAYDALNVLIEDYPHIKQWMDILKQRPAVQKGMSLLAN